MIKSKILGRYLNRNRTMFVLTNGKGNHSAHFASVKWGNFNQITSIFYIHSSDKGDLILDYMRVLSSEKVNRVIDIGLLPVSYIRTHMFKFHIVSLPLAAPVCFVSEINEQKVEFIQDLRFVQVVKQRDRAVRGPGLMENYFLKW